MRILSVSFTTPKTRIERSTITKLNPLLEQSTKSTYEMPELLRYTSLDLSYLTTTANRELTLTSKTTNSSTVTLGAEAVRNVLDRAGLSLEEVGLIVGQSFTSPESTPAYAAQVGCALAFKGPAFDIMSGSAGLVRILQVLASYKKDRVPQYVVCVVGDVLTQRIDYNSSDNGLYLSDGVLALLIDTKEVNYPNGESSPERVRGFQIDRIWLKSGECSALTLTGYEHLKLSATELMAAQSDRATELLREVLSEIGSTAIGEQGILIGGLNPNLASELATKLSLNQELFVRSPQHLAYCGAASIGTSLDQALSSLSRGSKLIVLDPGFGSYFGAITLHG